jgi:hypothetical protein
MKLPRDLLGPELVKALPRYFRSRKNLLPAETGFVTQYCPLETAEELVQSTQFEKSKLSDVCSV